MGTSAFLSIVVLGLFTAGALELFEQPSWIIAPLPVSVALVIVLNRSVYAFLARERGLLFVVCAVPLHLQYYFSSVLALIVGACIHLWKVLSTGWRVVEAAASRPMSAGPPPSVSAAPSGVPAQI